MAPPSLETAEKAMVAILHGLEIGLTPMAALQSIAVVNGRPTVYGDGAIALVRASGKCEYIREEVKGDGEAMAAVCEVKRKGEERPIIGRFSVGDAKRAGLWGKKGPWTQYPKRMLTMRARAFAMRDGFADVLRGLGIAEEVQDIPARQTHDQIPLPPAPPVKGPPMPPSPPLPVPPDDEPEIPDIASIRTPARSSIDKQDTARRNLDRVLRPARGGARPCQGCRPGRARCATTSTRLATFDGKPNGEVDQGIALAINRRHLKRVGG